jgi:hypothetical protein
MPHSASASVIYIRRIRRIHVRAALIYTCTPDLYIYAVYAVYTSDQRLSIHTRRIYTYTPYTPYKRQSSVDLYIYAVYAVYTLRFSSRDSYLVIVIDSGEGLPIKLCYPFQHFKHPRSRSKVSYMYMYILLSFVLVFCFVSSLFFVLFPLYFYVFNSAIRYLHLLQQFQKPRQSVLYVNVHFVLFFLS